MSEPVLYGVERLRARARKIRGMAADLSPAQAALGHGARAEREADKPEMIADAISEEVSAMEERLKEWARENAAYERGGGDWRDR